MLVPVLSDVKRNRSVISVSELCCVPQKVSAMGLEVNALDNVLHDDAADPYAAAVSASDDKMPPSFFGTCLQRVC